MFAQVGSTKPFFLIIVILQREARQDAIYWERILRWNKHPDAMLLQFLDVDTQFVQEEGPRQRDRHFLAAIHTLQQLKTTFTPVQKLAVVWGLVQGHH